MKHELSALHKSVRMFASQPRTDFNVLNFNYFIYRLIQQKNCDKKVV